GFAKTISQLLNATVSPDGKVVVAVTSQFFFIDLFSYKAPGLTQASSRNPNNFTFLGGGAFSPSSDRYYVLGSPNIYVYGIDPVTAALSATPLMKFNVPSSGAGTLSPMDSIAVHPVGGKLYYHFPDGINVYDTSTGTLLSSVTTEHQQGDIVSQLGGIAVNRN